MMCTGTHRSPVTCVTEAQASRCALSGLVCESSGIRGDEGEQSRRGFGVC